MKMFSHEASVGCCADCVKSPKNINLLLRKKNCIVMSMWCPFMTRGPFFLPFLCQAQSVGLLLVLDGQPQRVEWRSAHPRFKHSPVWVSFFLQTLLLTVTRKLIRHSVLLILHIPHSDKALRYVHRKKERGFHHKTLINVLRWNVIVASR